MTPRQLQELLDYLYERFQPLTEGTVADCVPEFAETDWFGISVVDVMGRPYHVGDTTVSFPIQSIAKPFVYGLALADRGAEYVLNRVGVEPTGDPFNSLLEPEELTERQYNPLVNAGAIATTSLVQGETPKIRLERMLALFHQYIGHDVTVDANALQRRRQYDHLNRAIAHVLLNFGLLEGDVEETLDLYFHQCSLRVTCQDLALMAATLANNGVNPLSGEPAIAPPLVKSLLSVMYTCGLYEFSGQWAYRVGLPAKSGLSGAIIAVVPERMGIAVFSPRLGEHRKSRRAVRVIEELSEALHLHIFSPVGTRLPPPQLMDPPATDDHLLANPSASNQYPTEPPKRGAAATNRNLDLEDFLHGLYDQYLPLREGNIYISESELVDVNPDWFGISIVTTNGESYAAGDAQVPFLIQSISKVLAYGLALEEHGRDYVLTRVDVEPSGEAYNSIIRVQASSKRPYNPMVNTGAIAITSLITGATPAMRLKRLLEMYRRYVGHRVFVDTPSYVSEQNTGDRNWAISYLLRNFGMISGDIQETMDLYLQQCSVIINCQDLALIGATLANNGVNPMTGERAIAADYIRDLLSVMNTCGMYDFAGEWVYKVGFPAKSGVGGGIVGVVPGQMGIAVYSPLLDKRGSSIRGIKVCEALSNYLKLHIFEFSPALFV